MKTLTQLLTKIEAVEQRAVGIADRRKAEHVDRETAFGALAFCCLAAAERELLRAASARDSPLGEAQSAAEARFAALTARFAACSTTTEAHDIWEEHHPGYCGFEPSILRVFAALKLPDKGGAP